MGLRVSKDISVLKDKTLVGTNFNKGGEHVLTVQDKKGTVQRVRIPVYLADIMDEYLNVHFEMEEWAR